MTDELKMLLAGLEKAAAEGKIMVGGTGDLPKEIKDVVAKIVSGLEDHECFKKDREIAMLSKELGDSMKTMVIAAAKSFVEINDLPKEELFDYIIYGTIANTLRFVLENNDDDDCECESCHCQPPKKPSSDNGSARAEADSADASLAAINALKDLLSKNN